MRRLTLLAVVALLVGACGDSKTPDAAATLDTFVRAYDAEDLERVMALFSEDSVMSSHPVKAFAVGLDDIRSAFADDVGQGISTTISNVSIEEVPADDATGITAHSIARWDQTWTSDADGKVLELCWSGHSAVISDGTIHILNWSRFDCP